MDDMLVKSRQEDDHLDDLKETFETLHSYNKMRIWGNDWKIPRVYGVLERH